MLKLNRCTLKMEEACCLKGRQQAIHSVRFCANSETSRVQLRHLQQVTQDLSREPMSYICEMKVIKKNTHKDYSIGIETVLRGLCTLQQHCEDIIPLQLYKTQ